MDDVKARLGQRFRKQQAFAAGYSPLYSKLFGLLADWLVAAESFKTLNLDWLVQAARSRSSFDVTLLLLAGLHRDILAGCPEVAPLGRYYSTVGGVLSCDDAELPAALRQALVSRQAALNAFVQTSQVQTNETARGLCWLLPICSTGWPSIHLVDLGASAGLNLAADQRHFRLNCSHIYQDQENSGSLDLGLGRPVQFTVMSEGRFRRPATGRCPKIVSRTGADRTPLCLKSLANQGHLAAFVWGDQPERLSLLRQGIAALQQVNQSAAPVRLHQVDLPDHLPRFLEEQITPLSGAPVVLYNTYLTTYLHDKGASLRRHLAAWAGHRAHPVLWLQWEPPRSGKVPPALGWVAWTADLWQQERHQHWHLGWTHPHGSRIQWLAGWTDWAGCWQRRAVVRW